MALNSVLMGIGSEGSTFVRTRHAEVLTLRGVYGNFAKTFLLWQPPGRGRTRGGFGSTPSLKLMGYKSPNEKLNIASIGAGGKAASDIRGCAPTENIVALCDVDDKQAANIYKRSRRRPSTKTSARCWTRKRRTSMPYRDDSGFHARRLRHGLHGARQARLRAKTADAAPSGKPA